MTRLHFAIDNALVVLTKKGETARYRLHLRGNNVACVTVDPLRPEFIYCGTFGSGLWRSDDAGESWRPAGEGIRGVKIQSVTVSRSERAEDWGIVYAGTEPSAIFRSDDAGETWQECGDLTALPSGSQWSFLPRPETHHVRWIEQELRDGLPQPSERHTAVLAAHPNEPGTFFAAWEHDVFCSVDGSASWRRIDVQLPEDCRVNELCALAVAESDEGWIKLSTR